MRKKNFVELFSFVRFLRFIIPGPSSFHAFRPFSSSSRFIRNYSKSFAIFWLALIWFIYIYLLKLYLFCRLGFISFFFIYARKSLCYFSFLLIRLWLHLNSFACFSFIYLPFNPLSPPPLTPPKAIEMFIFVLTKPTYCQYFYFYRNTTNIYIILIFLHIYWI